MVNGGLPNYQFSWDNGTTWNNNGDLCNDSANTYQVIVKDANGCSSNHSFTINNLNGPSIPHISSFANATCLNDSVHFSVSSPQGGIVYTWLDYIGIHTGVSYTSPLLVSTGTYTVSIHATDTAIHCNSANTTLTITINGLPNSAITGTNHFCKGASTQLIAPAGTYQYQWLLNGVVIAGQTSQSITATQSGTYSVVVTNSVTSCTSLSSGYTVTIDSLPTISSSSISINPTNCNANTGSVTGVTVSNTTGPYQYTWTDALGTIVSTSLTASSLGVGNYCFHVTDGNNCKDSLCAINVASYTAPAAPQVNPLNTSNYCDGQTINTLSVTASSGSTVIWYDSTQVNVLQNNSYTYTPVSPSAVGTHTYYVTAEQNGCTSAATLVTITLNQLPTAPVLTATSVAVCNNVGLTPLSVSSAVGTTLWYNANGNYLAQGTSYLPGNLAFNTPTTFYVKDSINNTHCVSASIPVTVIIYPAPVIDTLNKNIVPDKCGKNIGEVNGLQISGGTPTYHIQWYIGSNALQGDTTLNLTGMAGGTYSLVVYDAHNCYATGNQTSFTISSQPGVTAQISASPSSGTAPLPVTLTSTVNTTVNSYTWTLSDGTTNNLNSGFTHTFENAGVYTVSLTVSDGVCSYTTTTVITVDTPDIFIVPNIFTPNGDGINDVFFITCPNAKILTCDIYNRWGTLLYTIGSPNQGWDGRLNNGNWASEGEYFYILSATENNGKEINLHGVLTLVK